MGPSEQVQFARATFERAVRDHHAAVYRAAYRIVRGDAQALDATQQTFLRVLEGQLDLSTAQDVQRLLRCAAAREALMVLRAARNRRQREEHHAMERREGFDDRRVEQAELWNGVRRALAELPEGLRDAISLRFGEGLTFAEIGGVLEVSEPSAHQRVQRALAKLREKLERLGFAAALPSLTELLRRDESSPLPPSGIEARLLTLSAPAKASFALSASAALLSLAALGALGLAVWRTQLARGSIDAIDASAARIEQADERFEPTSALASSRRPTRSVENQSPAPTPTPPNTSAATFENGVLEGRVVDELGLPLADVEVRAASVERRSKLAEFSGATKTGRDGEFRLSLPVTLESGQDYAVIARTPLYTHDVGVVRIRSGRAAPRQRIEIAREVVSEPGAWRLWLTVRDAHGAPIAGALARLQWAVRNSRGEPYLQEQTRGVSAADGRVLLEGDGLGRKLLTFDARSAGFAPSREALVLETAGDVQREFVLQRGVAIVGTLSDVNGAPITAARLGSSNVSLYAASVDGSDWCEAKFPAPGRFEIPALAVEPYTLRFRHDRWSSFTLENITPGAGELALVLKTKADLHDRGAHDAEIHGTLVDDATGGPVSAAGLAVWLEPIDDACPALDDGDWAPLVVEAVIAQSEAGFSMEEDQPPAPAAHEFIYDSLAPGRYAVRVHARGFAPTLVGPIELAEREIASIFEVRLVRGAHIEGVVRDEHGVALEGAYVLPLGEGGLSIAHSAELDREIRSKGGRGSVYSSAAKTDAAGLFRLEHTPTDRRLRLVVLHPEHEPTFGEWLELRDGARASFELRAGAARER